MIGMKIKDAKGLFFDSPKVMRSVDRAARKVLSRFGAFVRRTAKSSIGKRKAVSTPGSPPSSHTGLLKKFIYFGYDAEKQSVVIGPARTSGSSDAPETLEHGGTTTIMVRKRGNTRRSERKTKHITVATRPFMQPALDKELPGLPAMWRDSVKP